MVGRREAVGVGVGGKMGERSQKVQTLSYKINNRVVMHRMVSIVYDTVIHI